MQISINKKRKSKVTSFFNFGGGGGTWNPRPKSESLPLLRVLVYFLVSFKNLNKQNLFKQVD